MIDRQPASIFWEKISRRQFAAGLISGGVMRWTGAETLAQYGKACGIEFGSAVRARTLTDSVQSSLIARECRVLTPELEMKWAVLAPSEGSRDTSGADAIARFAREHGLRLRGHTLLWHDSIPAWVRPRLKGPTGWVSVRDHIRATVSRYRSHVDEWDVVNEPIGDDGGLRASPFLHAFGPGYIRRALEDAHAAAPRSRLAINDYGLEYLRPADTARRAGLLKLATSLVRQKAPLHRIGMQAHLDIAHGDLARDGLRDFLKAIADLGLGISITELDVRERDLILPAGQRDQLAADHVARFLDIVLRQPAVASLSTWGLSDRDSWLEITDADRGRFPGAWADGSGPGVNRGLPYDAAGQAKPMRSAIVAAFAARSRRLKSL